MKTESREEDERNKKSEEKKRTGNCLEEERKGR